MQLNIFLKHLEKNIDRKPEFYTLENKSRQRLNDLILDTEEHIRSIELRLLDFEYDSENTDNLLSIINILETIEKNASKNSLGIISEVAKLAQSTLNSFLMENKKLNSKCKDLLYDLTETLRSLISQISSAITENKRNFSLYYDARPIIKEIKTIDMEKTNKAFNIDDMEIYRNKRLGEILLDMDLISREDIKYTIIKQIEGDKRRIGEILLEDRGISPKILAKGMRRQSQSKTAFNTFSEQTIRIDAEKMDQFLDMVGELVIINNILIENPALQETVDENGKQSLNQLKRIINSLQRHSMSLRTLPLRNIFKKMSLIISEHGKKGNKSIDLKLQGEGTELDRTIVEELYIPILQLIINSCDHGIETPEQRIAWNKYPTGTIMLKACQKGSNIIIEIEDDGRGIDINKVRNKGIEKGLISQKQELTVEQILDLIFQPGFTTSKQITEFSGRGMGMEKVKNIINKLGGSINIKTIEKKGTSFLITLPTNLSIIEGLVVEVGTEKFIIPLSNILETFMIKKSDYNIIAGKSETVKMRQKTLSLLRLHKIFQINKAEKKAWNGVLIACEREKEMIAILVDRIIKKQEIVIKSIENIPAKITEIYGGGILGDGSVSLILDINNIKP